MSLLSFYKRRLFLIIPADIYRYVSFYGHQWASNGRVRFVCPCYVHFLCSFLMFVFCVNFSSLNGSSYVHLSSLKGYILATFCYASSVHFWDHPCIYTEDRIDHNFWIIRIVIFWSCGSSIWDNRDVYFIVTAFFFIMYIMYLFSLICGIKFSH